MVILLLSAESFSYKRKYVQEVLVNCLFKLAQEKVWLGELTVPTITVDFGRKAIKQTNKQNQNYTQYLSSNFSQSIVKPDEMCKSY